MLNFLKKKDLRDIGFIFPVLIGIACGIYVLASESTKVFNFGCDSITAGGYLKLGFQCSIIVAVFIAMFCFLYAGLVAVIEHLAEVKKYGVMDQLVLPVGGFFGITLCAAVTVGIGAAILAGVGYIITLFIC